MHVCLVVFSILISSIQQFHTEFYHLQIPLKEYVFFSVVVDILVFFLRQKWDTWQKWPNCLSYLADYFKGQTILPISLVSYFCVKKDVQNIKKFGNIFLERYWNSYFSVWFSVLQTVAALRWMSHCARIVFSKSSRKFFLLPIN